MRIGRRRAVTTVKKNVPPGEKARLYSGMAASWRRLVGFQEWWVDEADPPYRIPAWEHRGNGGRVLKEGGSMRLTHPTKSQTHPANSAPRRRRL